MTDNQDSVTAGAVQPPTDRPLTAGDVPLLREGDVLRVVVAAARNQEWDDVKQPAIGEEVVFIKPFGSGGVSNCIVTSFDPAFGYRPGRFTFVSRPATSAASEGAVDRVMAVLNHWFDGRARIDRNSDMVAQLAALASPPVSERERELEGALKLAKERIQSWPIDDHETCMCGSLVEGHDIGSGHSPVSQADHALSTIVQEIDRALTAQPAGDGK